MSKKQSHLLRGPAYVNGKITLLGAFNRGKDDIPHRPWNDETEERYNGYYSQLCPILNGPLEDYDQETVEWAVAQARPEGDSVARKMLYLVRIVVKYAAEQSWIDEDYLWGSGYSEDEAEEDTSAEERTVLRKSLTVQEEIAVAEELLENPYQVGQKVGLLLMFALGLRNNEACAVKFESVKTLSSHPKYHVVYIYETATEGGELKAGGKTQNAYRIIFLPEPVFQFLQKRKNWIKSRIKTGEIQLPPGVSDVDQLTVACKNDTLEGCKPSDLGKTGRQLFKTIHMNEDQFSQIGRTIKDKEKCEEMGIREKEPTAYLLRRNFATHLSILSLTQAEIEYVMGHEILSNEIERGDFENEDLLYRICRKLARRPLLNNDFDKAEEVQIPKGRAFTFSNAEKFLAHIEVSPDETLRIQIKSREPVDVVAAKLSVAKPHKNFLPEVSCIQSVEKCDEYGAEVNILSAYHATYRDALTRKKAASKLP